MQFIIEAQNVGCIYSKNSKEGLEDNTPGGVRVNTLKVPSIGITTITGPSGSGKSTLIGLLSGLRQENSDSPKNEKLLKFEKFDRSYSLLDPKNFQRGDFGFVFQEAQLLKSIPAKLNAEMAAMSTGQKLEDSTIDSLAAELGIFEKLDKKTAALSGGQAQRLACIRALAIGPDVLVCDEPTSSLDKQTGHLLMQTIKAWAESEQKAVLWVTHDLELAAEFSDFLIRVDKGAVECNHDGTPFNLASLSKAERHAQIAAPALSKIIEVPEKVATLQQTEINEKKSQKIPKSRESFTTFCFRMAIFEIYGGDQNSVSNDFNFQVIFNKFFGAFSRSMTWAICLGIVVLFALFSLWGATKSYFDAQFEAMPPHFTFFTQGEALNIKRLISLKKEIKRSSKLNIDDNFLYGRREIPMQKIWLPSEAGCSYLPAKETRTSLMVFDKNEPLFKNHFGTLEKKQNAYDTPYILSTKRFDTAVEKHLFPRLETSVESTELTSICVSFYGVGVEFAVAHAEGTIPGGSDGIFSFAMPAKFYRDAAIEVDPSRYRDDGFSDAAVYFDQNSRKQILCAFEPLDDCKNAPIITSSIRLNKDALKQVDKLMGQSYVATIVLTLLIVSFTIVISMSTTLAVSAFVHSNEKTLALLKAFRAGTKNLLLILNAHTLVLFTSALVLAGLICSIGSWIVIEQLLDHDNMKLIDFGLGLREFFGAAVIILSILMICSSSVIMSWNRKHEYVGEILQSV